MGAPAPVMAAGLCDLQVNGFAGVDFNDPAMTADDLARALVAMEASGVTWSLPTLITSSLERFSACARTIARSGAPGIAGIHMEGPYIAPDAGPRGAHDAGAVRAASLDDFERRQEAADGRIRLVTLAPEVEGALGLIPRLVERGVLVAIGHTAAAPEIIREAAVRGARLSTHLGNGCAATLPRHPNLLWEQLALDALDASFIADGHHLSAATLKAMVRAKTPSRSLLVTDATAAAGSPPGEYTLGVARIRRDAHGRVTGSNGARLAGSALTLDAAIGNAVRDAGVSLDEALAMASTRPAAWLGLTPRGRLDAGWDASSARFTVRRVHV